MLETDGGTASDEGRRRRDEGRRPSPGPTSRRSTPTTSTRPRRSGSPDAPTGSSGWPSSPCPDGFKRWFGTLFAAFPDARFEVISVTAQKENAAVRYRVTGTFDGTGKFEGLTPNGARDRHRGLRPVHGPRRPDRREPRLPQRRRPRPSARRAAAAGLARRARDDRRAEREGRGRRARRRAQRTGRNWEISQGVTRTR